MADYDINQLQEQQATIVIASTFGEGEAPNNGVEFKKSLVKMREENSKIRYADKSSWYTIINSVRTQLIERKLNSNFAS